MTFVTAALAAAGLLAMAIPILIHLLWRQRRRPLQWAAMRFLMEAYKKHRRRLQLEQLLLLAVRCLILAVMGFALARPVLKAAGIDLGGSRTVYLVIDNGLASSVRLEDGRTALEHQLDHARAVVEELSPGDFVGVMTAAGPAQSLVIPPSSDLDAIVTVLESIKGSESATDLGGALTILKDTLTDSDEALDRTLVYLLSEFREGSAPAHASLPTSLVDLPKEVKYFAPVPSSDPIGNVQIVSVDPVRSIVLPGAADGSGQVTVHLGRSGDQLGTQVSTVRITGDEFSRVTAQTVNWTPGQSTASADFALDVAARGERELAMTVSIDGDQLSADDHRYAVLQSRTHIRVLLVDRRSFGYQPTLDRLVPGQWLRRALEPVEDGPLQVVDVDPVALDVTDLRTADVVLTPRPDLLDDNGWELLHRFVDNGGLLLIMPPADVTVHRWVTAIQERMHIPWRILPEAVDHDPPLLLDDDYHGGALLHMISGELAPLLRPVYLSRHLPLEEAATQGQRALRGADGSTLMISGAPTQRFDAADAQASKAGGSRGLVVYLATALDLQWTNMPSKPLMVPLLHEVIRQGMSLIRNSSQATVGGAETLDLPVSTVALVNADGKRVDAVDGRSERPLETSGLWSARDAAGLALGTVAVNVNVAASRTVAQPPNVVETWLGEAGDWTFMPPAELASVLSSVDAGSPISYLLLLALLALVVLETMLARWFSHAFRSTDVPILRESTDRLVAGGVR